MLVEQNGVFINKLNENGKVARNKARFLYKGYAQVEGIEFESTFSLVARIETIRMFLAFTICYSNFKVYQMDINSAFLIGSLE